ncbi:MAG: MerR family transcriptional regulator [Lachnospiraceae bacterium]|nr:MerR family transcriptional regulator [Lachnospiraceae bacterium]
MLQIGEFSRICCVSVKTLHHYDKIGLLAPAEVDRITGYRYYRTEQIDTMNYIGRLKRYGFSLEEIQHLLTVSDHKELANALRRQKEKLKRERQEMDIILNELQTHISVFERTGDIMTYQKGYTIEIKQSPVMNVLAKRAMMGVDEFGKYYGTLFERVPKEHVTPTGLNGAKYYDEEFNHESSDVEVFIEIKEKEKADAVLESCECATTVHHGGYSTLSEAYGAIVTWIIENGYEIVSAPFELYVKTQFDSPSPEDWETEVYFPIRKKR